MPKYSVTMDFRQPVYVIVDAPTEEQALYIGEALLRTGSGVDMDGEWIAGSSEVNEEE